MSNRVEVIRNNPTWRDKLFSMKSFYGVINVKAETLTYLHITGTILFPEISSQIRSLVSRLDKCKIIDEFDKIVNMVRKSESNVLERGLEILKLFRVGGQPAIPGSSIKGVLRSRLELLFKQHGNRTRSCFIRAIPRAGLIPSSGHGWRHGEIWRKTGSILEDRGIPCDATRWEYYEDIKVCDTCNLLGTSGLSSRVDFSTFYLENSNDIEQRKVFFVCKPDKQVSGLAEVYKPGSIFTGEILVKGVSLIELGLIAMGLRFYENKPVLLGRFKYRRLASCLDTDAKPLVFGRIKFTPIEFNLSFTNSDYVRELSKEISIGFREEGLSIVIDDYDLEKLFSYAKERACEKYNEFLSKDHDEVVSLNSLWEKEEEWWNNCEC